MDDTLYYIIMIPMALLVVSIPIIFIFGTIKSIMSDTKNGKLVTQVNSKEYKKIPSGYLYIATVIGTVLLASNFGDGGGILVFPFLLISYLVAYILSELIRHIRIYIENRAQKNAK